MRFYKRLLNQSCTYWAPGGLDMFGNPSFSTPVSIICRWEDKREQFINRKAEELVSQSMVYVNQTVVEGGYLFLGTSATADPKSVTGALPIEKFEQVPDIKGVIIQRLAVL